MDFLGHILAGNELGVQVSFDVGAPLKGEGTGQC